MTMAERDLHPIAEFPADSCTVQQGVAGPWIDRLPHFRVDAEPSAGAEIQSEYVMPVRHARDAIAAMWSIGDVLAEQLLVSEIRTVAADDLWLSMNYHQNSVAFHFTWRRNWPEVQALLVIVERALAPFAARPHWGKTFVMDGLHVAALYPRAAEFRRLIESTDPAGKFRNAFVERNLRALT